MMRQFELVERVLAYNPNADEALLNRAYVYGMQKHGPQLRESGDPYFAHPLEVAAILTDLKLDDATIAVALLHDTIEDTDATRAEIDQLFGSEIGAIVDGLTKIDKLNLVSREEAQAENLRKLLLAISKDVRVLLVKLADRLHNMRTLEFVSPDKRRRIAQETMDIYAPLAGRMGMQDMRTELENIAFKTLDPDHYETIASRLAAIEKKNAITIDVIKAELTQKFEAEGIKAEVSGRLKSAWSIFTKIERKKVAFEQLSDMIGFRVIVDSLDDCYRTLGVVHTTWKVVPGRFKDYISVPKQNDYRSIHTTVVGPGRQRVELQIRARDMHEVAEFGIAAHGLYKEGILAGMERLQDESRAFGWLRSTIGNLTAGHSTEEFLEFTKLELFQDQVFCFTPRGRLIALPRGATPIDFAYAVHTELGDQCVGAKINGSIVPLVTSLHSGDEVEILTEPGHSPPANWEGIAATGKARAAIRRAVRISTQKRAVALGTEILELVLSQDRLILDSADREKLAEVFGIDGERELLIAIGEGKVASEDLGAKAARLKGVRRRRRKIALPVADKADGWFGVRNSSRFKFRIPAGEQKDAADKALLGKLDFNMPIRISPEGVVPGDRIVALLDRAGEICVYPIHSEALSTLDDKGSLWIDARWDLAGHEDRLYKVAISMLAHNRPGTLAEISTVIANGEANVHNMFMLMASPDFHRLVFQIEVKDLSQLTDVLTGLKQASCLSAVERANIEEASAISKIDWAGDMLGEEHDAK